MSRAVPLLMLVVTACAGGASRSEPSLTASPRLITTYILTTIQQTIVDFEAIREYMCDPRRNLVTMCQRSERVRTSLQFTQTQITRLLGDVPDQQQLHLPLPAPR
jgi:hypothetical protein